MASLLPCRDSNPNILKLSNSILLGTGSFSQTNQHYAERVSRVILREYISDRGLPDADNHGSTEASDDV